jgi:hypothetical protein
MLGPPARAAIPFDGLKKASCQRRAALQQAKHHVRNQNMDSDIKAREVGEALPSGNGIRQLADAIGSYPLARIAEDALNSNPMHQVIPNRLG